MRCYLLLIYGYHTWLYFDNNLVMLLILFFYISVKLNCGYIMECITLLSTFKQMHWFGCFPRTVHE